MTTHAIEILPAQPGHAIGVHGLDDETKALLGYLARYKGRTLKNYEYDLKVFQQWTRQMGLLRMLDCERFHLELYVRYLTEKGLAPSTVNRRFGTTRGFFKFAHVDGLITKDPAAYVATPKVEHDQQHRTWFETVDMALVLRMATDPLDRALLRLMYDLALRVGEVCSLDIESIERTSSGVYLRFIGKGNKLAVMMVPYQSLAAIDAYLALDGRTTGPLFLTRYGSRIGRHTVQRVITRVSKDAGITYHVSTHGVRRTHARDVVIRGGTYDDAADNLRHSDSRITKLCYAVDTHSGDLGRMKASAAMGTMTR